MYANHVPSSDVAREAKSRRNAGEVRRRRTVERWGRALARPRWDRQVPTSRLSASADRTRAASAEPRRLVVQGRFANPVVPGGLLVEGGLPLGHLVASVLVVVTDG